MPNWLERLLKRWRGKTDQRNNATTGGTPPVVVTEVPVNRYAVLAGSNFVGTPSELAGCINDIVNVRKMIEASGITILADLRDHDMTAANWKAALTRAMSMAKPGDMVFHMHSHHGAQIRDPSEADGLAEIWCADDFDWSEKSMITDKWMAALLASNPGVIWVDWADCCHAGDSLKELWCPGEKPRYIRNPDLKGFSPTKLAPMVVSGSDRSGILLAACRSAQTSADARLNGEACGAFSHFMLQALKENPTGTYEVLMLRATQLLGLGGYDQKPELDCRSGDEKRTFSGDVMGKI